MSERNYHYQPASLASTPTIPNSVLDLVSAFQRASPAERVRAAKLIGIDVVWDCLIVPALD